MTDPVTPAVDKPVQKSSIRKDLGWDDLVEDFIGLNIRGVKTIWAAFVRPAKFFEAARVPDWNDQYTPSVRVVFTIVALMMIFSFIWIGKSTPTYRMYLDIFTDVVAKENIDADPVAMTDKLFNYWLLAYPFVYGFVHLIASLILRIWGAGTDWVTRIRLYFAGMLPGATLTFLMLPILYFVSNASFGAISLGMLLATFGIHLLTVFRGTKFRRPGVGGRFWRGGLYALYVVIVDTVLSMISFAGAMFYMGFESGAFSSG